MWDRESGTLLHHIRAQTVGGDLTCIAWNHAWDTFMFATGSHDGGVRIWTSPAHSVSGPNMEDYLSVLSSRNVTNANTPRSLTPLPYDADYRTRSPSPAPQLSSDSQESHANGSTNGHGHSVHGLGPAPTSPSPSTMNSSKDAATGAPPDGRLPVVAFS